MFHRAHKLHPRTKKRFSSHSSGVFLFIPRHQSFPEGNPWGRDASPSVATTGRNALCPSSSPAFQSPVHPINNQQVAISQDGLRTVLVILVMGVAALRLDGGQNGWLE